MVRFISFFLFLPLLILISSCSELLFTGKSFKGTSFSLPPGFISTSQTFTHVGGFKIPDEFTSSGIGLVTNSNGDVIKVVAGNHTYQQSMAVYDIRGKPILGSTNVASYPSIAKEITLTRNALFPNWDSRHDLRDYFITSTGNGLNNRICGVGRMYYNTNPQPSTNIHCRQTSNNFTTLGTYETIPVNIPEQFVTGFSSASESRLWGGAYDSGQGTTMGPVLAKKEPSGSWSYLYRAPNLGNFTNSPYPLLPRPLGYNCVAGNTWVCHEPMAIPPTNQVQGIWTTSRIGGGGAEIGDVAMILPTVGFGDIDYVHQSYTFGLSHLDKAYAYYFRRDVNGMYQFVNFDEWPFSNPGEHIYGMKIGKLEGQPGIYLFVIRTHAYYYGIYKAGSVVDIFRILAEAQ